MIRVQQALGRAVITSVHMPVETVDVLRFQQERSLVLRRLGDPALLLTDLRELRGLDVSTGRMLAAMLGSATLVQRHAMLVTAGTVGAEIALDVAADHGERWQVCTSVEALIAFITPVATPAEIHAARSLSEDQAAA